ncbi:MAG TPA: nuclear transport factor 2 family protein [Thermodesulfobacteriota bacterium]
MLPIENAMQKNQPSVKSSAKEIVMEFVQALQRKDFKTIGSYISDNMTGVAPGPEGLTYYNKAAFMSYVEHGNVPPYDIKKEFADSNDVCLLYEATYQSLYGEPVKTFVCAWFHVNDDWKISSVRFVFDPRPLFQQK